MAARQCGFAKRNWQRMPVCSPEQVDPVYQDDGLVLADVRPREWLPHTIRFRNGVGIHESYIEAILVTPDKHGLMQIRKRHGDRAPASAGADHEHPQRTASNEVGRENMFDAHFTSPE
jgi:hypothetical protein